MKKYRLHEVEALLDLFSAEPYVFRPADLYEIDGVLRDEMKKYNIYAIGVRPRISFVPDSLSLNYSEQQIEGRLSVNLGHEIKEIPFKYKNILDKKITSLGELEYPYTKLRFNLGGQFCTQMSTHDVIRFSETSLFPYSDLKIEYVGQAYGDEGSSDAINRLIGKTGKQGHGALQKVLADINDKKPECEVYVLLYSFGFYKKVVCAGAGPKAKTSFDDSPNRLYELLDAIIPRENRIDLVEASLIRYFEPKYNEHYKKTFPKVTHDILKELFDNDITGLSTSLSTTEHNIRVYSGKVKPSDEHLSMYSIVKDEERASFLDLSMPASEILA